MMEEEKGFSWLIEAAVSLPQRMAFHACLRQPYVIVSMYLGTYILSTLSYTVSHQINAWVAAHTAPRTTDTWLWIRPIEFSGHSLSVGARCC